MAAYITYWPKEQIKKIQKEQDCGPITVIFGSIHTKMPSIKKVKVGDTIYPVTLMDGALYVAARLEVSSIEPAYLYLIRELGNRCSALVPDDIDGRAYDRTPFKAHRAHQKPFKCCAETAAQGTEGSSIALRQIPKEQLPLLEFGSTKRTQKPMRFDQNGAPSILSVSGSVRRMSDETQVLFDCLF